MTKCHHLGIMLLYHWLFHLEEIQSWRYVAAVYVFLYKVHLKFFITILNDKNFAYSTTLTVATLTIVYRKDILFCFAVMHIFVSS